MTETSSTNTMVYILLVLVLIISGLGIKTAIDQRQERIAWMNSVESRFEGTTMKVDMLYKYVSQIPREIPEQKILQVINDYVRSQPIVQQQEYEKVAGCYGIVPEDPQAAYNLTCYKNFK